jgi:tRNA/tmRNA/rRNA uracil-C5-methylase (TrmA/RlmC/RlmD family)
MSAVEAARRNAQRNGVRNSSFVEADASAMFGGTSLRRGPPRLRSARNKYVVENLGCMMECR